MKVILYRSVDNLGSAGETVDVKPGYFRNFLGPRGFALEHNKANLALVESRRKKIEAMVARERAEASKSAEDLNGQQLTFQLRANDKGQLFGSVTASDVAKELGNLGFTVDRRKIEFSEAIKTTGDYSVKIRLYPGVFAEVGVKVERFLRPEEREAIEAEERRQAERKAKKAKKEEQEEEGAAAAEATAEAVEGEEAAAEENKEEAAAEEEEK